MSCKSSLCLRCAKVYVDNWVSHVSQMLHDDVIYRHIVLPMPALLRTTFYRHAGAWLNPFMRCGVQCLDDCFSRVSGYPLKGGYIMVSNSRRATNPSNRHDIPVGFS
jgi:Transposase zinc-binding domain